MGENLGWSLVLKFEYLLYGDSFIFGWCFDGIDGVCVVCL